MKATMASRKCQDASALSRPACPNDATHRCQGYVFCAEHAPDDAVKIEPGYYRTYFARRNAGRGIDARVTDGDKMYDLRHIVYHSPTGFEMGYMGSGPADLALAIMFDYFGYADEAPERITLGNAGLFRKYKPAFLLYQRVKETFVAVRKNQFLITGAEIAVCIDEWRKKDETLREILSGHSR